jgi:NAD+ synthase
MILNYVYANLEGKIVIGTGNKTELLLGYFTKYGDAGVDILPIGDLYKTQVRQVARYLKLPKEIIDKVPSAGLWPGQTDEAEIGAGYEEIDNILYLLIEKGYSQEETATKLNVELELVKDLYERMKRNEHKRKTPAVTKLQAIP